MAKWIIIPEALKRIRTEKHITIPAFSQHSGISDRMLREYERREQAIRLVTLQILETSLGAKATEFARFVDDRRPARAAAKDDARDDAAAPATRTALEALVSAERAAGAKEARAHGADPLSAKSMQDVFTAYRLHDGRRFWLAGDVRTQRGIPAAEARLLGGKAGVAARFHVYKRVTKDHELGVTVHAAKAAHTRALQAAQDRAVTLVVKVVVVPAEAAETGHGFSSFITAITDKRPWTFVVDEIV
jgi:transcriptional regulator with XRE-family HTH domain